MNSSDETLIYGTVASSPRAAADRFRGCLGTVRIDTNYTKPPRSRTHTSTSCAHPDAWSSSNLKKHGLNTKASVNAVCDGDASRSRMHARHRDESTLHGRHQCDP